MNLFVIVALCEKGYRYRRLVVAEDACDAIAALRIKFPKTSVRIESVTLRIDEPIDVVRVTA